MDMQEQESDTDPDFEPMLTCDEYAELRTVKRRARIAQVAQGHVVPFYVAAISISRLLGGREEGGWWYDATQIVEVRKAWDWQTGLKHARELRENHPTCRYGRFSAAGGSDIEVRTFRALEDLPEETTGRPRYE